MNFYRAQQDARRKTWQLGLLFGAAVLSLILLTNLLVGVSAFWLTTTGVEQGVNLNILETIPLEFWAMVSAAVLGVVGLACLYKYFALRGGGRAVAESLGGTRLMQGTKDYKHKRLLNVVEEMALAAGIPVPPVYLIDEPSINAFAAGMGTDDAVIGINQGTIDLLNREELQGVVAHEFSHIMNGDTRINLRLIIMLHGILFIGIVGYMVLRSTGHRSSGRNGNSALPLLALGGGLMAIGYGGTFFGNLIKAGVSRQREFLADSSAVQYTRNPQGIGGALKKIGGYVNGSLMSHPNAKEASHMFFGDAMEHRLSNFLSTHPPLPVRIKAIEPNWNGEFPAIDAAVLARQINAENPLASSFSGAATTVLEDSFDVLEHEVAAVNEAVGNPSDESHDNALLVMQSTDTELLEAAHNPLGAKALAYAMLLSDEESPRQQQMQLLQSLEQLQIPEHTAVLHSLLQDSDDLHQITLLRAAMPALKEMSRAQYQKFFQTVVDLIKADKQIELFEWVLHRLLVKELKPHFERVKPIRWRYAELAQVADETCVLLSALARAASSNPETQQQAFAQGLSSAEVAGTFNATQDPNFARLTAALNRLKQLAPLAKPKLIKACAATVLADENVTVAEGALLQGVAATLDCPLPPAIYRHIR